jgi:hypothetical protein
MPRHQFGTDDTFSFVSNPKDKCDTKEAAKSIKSATGRKRGRLTSDWFRLGRVGKGSHDIQHNDTQHNNKSATLGIMTIDAYAEYP